MKKYLSIFLIFFLLFGLSVPAFAAEQSDVLPPVIDSSVYDSYFITLSDSGLYHCYLFDSSAWHVYVKPGESSLRGISFDQPLVPIKYDSVNADSYNPSSGNNGWGAFGDITSLSDKTSDDTIYYYNVLLGNIFLSNRDVPYAVVDFDTKTVNNTGEFFFTLNPLVTEVGEALTQFQIQTSQTIMIILLCGIGCLAFLISLPVLRKVLLRFLNR